MRLGVIVVTVALAAVLAACESHNDADQDQSERSQKEQKQREDPLAGVANNLDGIQRGSEDGFGRAADATQ